MNIVGQSMECSLKPCPCATHVSHDCLAQVLRKYFGRFLHFPWLQRGAEREKQKCLSQTRGMIPGMGRKRTPGLMRLTRTRVKIHGGLLLRMTFQLMVTACWWRIHGLAIQGASSPPITLRSIWMLLLGLLRIWHQLQKRPASMTQMEHAQSD